MFQYLDSFNTILGVKPEPNEHEVALFERAQKYTQKLAWIPGIEMVAVSNSLSMYATHADSDIDLFIVTKPRMIWFVRLFVTLRLWIAGVWRHGDDIAGNFCLSFFITTDAMDLEKIAIENDVYLYYWIYYLKPILVRDDIYEQFLKANNWVDISKEQRIQNQRFGIQNFKGGKEENSWGLGEGTVGVRGKQYIDERKRTSAPFGAKRRLEIPLGYFLPESAFGTFGTKSTEILCLRINKVAKSFFLPHTLKSYRKLGKPPGIIINDTMLKFHPEDRRESIRNTIVEKNFDK